MDTAGCWHSPSRLDKAFAPVGAVKLSNNSDFSFLAVDAMGGMHEPGRISHYKGSPVGEKYRRDHA